MKGKRISGHKSPNGPRDCHANIAEKRTNADTFDFNAKMDEIFLETPTERKRIRTNLARIILEARE